MCALECVCAQFDTVRHLAEAWTPQTQGTLLRLGLLKLGDDAASRGWDTEKRVEMVATECRGRCMVEGIPCLGTEGAQTQRGQERGRQRKGREGVSE